MLINITKKIVIVFVIGVLVGAIIATMGFLIFGKTAKLKNAPFAPQSSGQSQDFCVPQTNGKNNQGNFTNNNQKPQLPNNNSNSQEGSQNQMPQNPGGNSSNNMSELPNSSSF